MHSIDPQSCNVTMPDVAFGELYGTRVEKLITFRCEKSFDLGDPLKGSQRPLRGPGPHFES